MWREGKERGGGNGRERREEGSGKGDRGNGGTGEDVGRDGRKRKGGEDGKRGEGLQPHKLLFLALPLQSLDLLKLTFKYCSNLNIIPVHHQCLE